MSEERSQGAGLAGLNASAKALVQTGKFAEAIEILRGATQGVAVSAELQEALYLQAVCHRYNGQLADAEQKLSELINAFPDYARAHQERGHVCVQQHQLHDAVQAYERAVNLNPALGASWKKLAELYRAANEPARVEHCLEQVKALQSLPAELLSVTSMIYEGKLYKAENLCRAFVQKNKQHVEAMRLLAMIATKLKILDDADFLLESCLVFSPNYTPARFDYAQVLFKRQRYQKSLEQSELLLQQQSDNPAFRLIHANASVPVGNIQQAIEHYEALIEQNPRDVQYHMLKGHALKTSGNQQGAVDAYHQAAQYKPDHGDAYWSLANLKTYRFSQEEVSRMIDLEQRDTTSTQNRYQICFSLGKSFEDAGDFRQSFAFYERGNTLKQSECDYATEKLEHEFSRMKKLCTAEFFQQRAEFGVDDRDPIFILGMPRSGSTLLEQILDSHPDINGTIELPNVLSLSQKLAGRRRADEESRYPDKLAELKQDQFTRFAEDYLHSTRVYRQGARYFTDKMPNNFRHIGLIQLMFPRAKIIDARRHPMACCFSNFKQLFGEGQEFSYGLEQVGSYYRNYIDLMDHWNTVLPGKILLVQHEDVVDDLESQVHRLLDFLELPFDRRCIEFHKNARAVHTPSAEQVRQPIFTNSLEQWKNFDEFLPPLKASLGPALSQLNH